MSAGMLKVKFALLVTIYFLVYGKHDNMRGVSASTSSTSTSSSSTTTPSTQSPTTSSSTTSTTTTPSTSTTTSSSTTSTPCTTSASSSSSSTATPAASMATHTSSTTTHPSTEIFSWKFIVIIASAGGTFVLVLLILIVCLVILRKRRMCCWKRDDKDRDTEREPKQSNGHVHTKDYDTWSLDSGRTRWHSTAASTGTVNEGFGSGAFESVPLHAVCDERQDGVSAVLGETTEQAGRTETREEAGRTETEAVVYAVVNKHKHPARHEYVNVAPASQATASEPAKPSSVPEPARTSEDAEGGSTPFPKSMSNQKSPVFPSDTKGPAAVAGNAFVHNDNPVAKKSPPTVSKSDAAAMSPQPVSEVDHPAAKKAPPPVSQKPKILAKPSKTGTKKTPMLPPDHKLPLVTGQEGRGQAAEDEPRSVSQDQRSALIPPQRKAPDHGTRTDGQAPRARDLQTEPGDAQTKHAPADPAHAAVELERNESAKILANGLVTTFLGPADRPERRSGIVNSRDHFYFILDKEPDGPGDPAEGAASSDGPRQTTRPALGEKTRDPETADTHPAGPFSPTAGDARPDSSNYYSMPDPPLESHLEANDDDDDNYYSVPGPPLAEAARSGEAQHATYYGVTDLVADDKKARAAVVAGRPDDYNTLQFDGKGVAVDGSVVGGQDVYSHLNEGVDDDVYSHAERDGHKVEIIGEDYCRIRL